ncbi:MAG TPA: hypothetical protein VIT24_00660 [Acidimicrobiales bacterium]
MTVCAIVALATAVGWIMAETGGRKAVRHDSAAAWMLRAGVGLCMGAVVVLGYADRHLANGNRQAGAAVGDLGVAIDGSQIDDRWFYGFSVVGLLGALAAVAAVVLLDRTRKARRPSATQVDPGQVAPERASDQVPDRAGLA